MPAIHFPTTVESFLLSFLVLFDSLFVFSVSVLRWVGPSPGTLPCRSVCQMSASCPVKGFPDPGDWPSESLPTQFNFVSRFVQFHFLILSFLIYLGVVDYLTTEISTSKQKKFSLVTFVDTPGLVDGDMKYPFDVNEAIQWLGILKPTDFLLHFLKTIFFLFVRGVGGLDLCLFRPHRPGTLQADA